MEPSHRLSNEILGGVSALGEIGNGPLLAGHGSSSNYTKRPLSKRIAANEA